MVKLKNYIISRLGKDLSQFLRHSVNYLIGNFATQALAFISIPVLTRLLLPEEYGLISIVNSITQIFTILMILNFHGALTRKYHENDGLFSGFFGTITIFLLIYNIIFVASMYYFRDFFSSFFNIDSKLFLIAITTGFLGLATTLYLSYLQASQQSKKYAIISFVRSMAILIVSILWIIFLSEDRYLGRLYSGVLINFILFTYSLYNIIKISTFKTDFRNIKYAVSFGVPLIPHAMSGFVLAQFDRVIINQINGAGDAGLYSFAYNVGMLMNVVVMSLNKSWVPIFYSKLKDSRHEDVGKMVKNYTKLVLLAALGLILFSKEIVVIIADPEYFTALNLVPIIILSYVFVYFYTIYGNYSFYRKKTYLISLNTILACVINVVLNYLFIPKYGYIAAAYTTLISYIALFVLHYLNAKIVLKEKIPSIKSYIKDVIVFTILIVFYKLIEIDNMNIIMSILIKFALLGSYILFIVLSLKRERRHKY